MQFAKINIRNVGYILHRLNAYEFPKIAFSRALHRHTHIHTDTHLHPHTGTHIFAAHFCGHWGKLTLKQMHQRLSPHLSLYLVRSPLSICLYLPLSPFLSLFSSLQVFKKCPRTLALSCQKLLPWQRPELFLSISFSLYLLLPVSLLRSAGRNWLCKFDMHCQNCSLARRPCCIYVHIYK